MEIRLWCSKCGRSRDQEYVSSRKMDGEARVIVECRCGVLTNFGMALPRYHELMKKFREEKKYEQGK